MLYSPMKTPEKIVFKISSMSFPIILKNKSIKNQVVLSMSVNTLINSNIAIWNDPFSCTAYTAEYI